ncbi:hypothetical protein [Candidatus Villigracilis saccharophilus]|uniref:hypothetical protein n=1 Tax=Candidatus Villigracilis saccharophilus TaxID=3140684 RepID=UPI0031366FC4|nr:hypothetical protein [Anaerolineales bacterium]
MTEIDLLEKYEPVLRFAKSERFFPMAVEPYLERCSIFPSGPQGVVEAFAHLQEPMPSRIGKLKSEQFYLRFVNKPLNDSDAWLWWAALSIIGVAGGWFLAGLSGVEAIIAISLVVAITIFIFASPIRLRIIPAAFAALFFIALEIAPIWFFLRPSEYVSIQVEYLILLPLYLIVLFYLSVRTMKFILERVVPEGPGMVMDMLSQATEKIAQESFLEYSKILEKDPQPVYYGRVVFEEDANKNRWTILQYHYFYAFNDWRLAANGINHHEGDWEMVAVYLKNDQPYAVLFSQHGAGNIEKWETVNKAVDKFEKTTTHPIVYVALGSHANYSKPEAIRSPSMYKPGRLQRLLFWTDGVIHYLFLLFNPNQKARQIALNELQVQKSHFLTEDALMNMRDEADHYVVSLPFELATGDGFRVGFQGNNLREGVVKSSSYLKRFVSDRKTIRPQKKEWRRVLLNPEPGWVQYKGLWGVKSVLNDESGPPGPKWDRPRKKQLGVHERIRWSRPLDWLAELEKNIR